MSKQLDYWRGDFGDSYVDRNAASPSLLKARTQLWAEILQSLGAERPESILEVGANIGINLRALRALTDATFYAVEPNERARSCLVDDGVVPSSQVRASAASAIDFPDGVVDLAFTSGVLIHIPPEDLETSCREIYRCARRFIVCIEYFADKPETIAYRGKSELLFKRDFGAYWIEIFPSLTSMRWGFAWKQATGLDNLTWWLFRK